MTRSRTVSAREMIRFLRFLGFSELRCKGRHRFFAHADGRTATVPDHRGEDLGRGIVRAILRDIDVLPNEFSRWLLS